MLYEGNFAAYQGKEGRRCQIYTSRHPVYSRLFYTNAIAGPFTEVNVLNGLNWGLKFVDLASHKFLRHAEF